MSFSHFLSADDHLCVGFSQALGTSVYSHPLSLLSSAHFLRQQKYACVSSGEECCYHTGTGHAVCFRVNESWGVKSQEGATATVSLEFHIRATFSCPNFVKFILASLIPNVWQQYFTMFFFSVCVRVCVTSDHEQASPCMPFLYL